MIVVHKYVCKIHKWAYVCVYINIYIYIYIYIYMYIKYIYNGYYWILKYIKILSYRNIKKTEI